MTAPTTRSAAIAAMCRQCIHDPAAAGTWREQVAACPSTDCPLWRFRPAQHHASCPAWIKSRDPADLPKGWAKLEQAEAVRAMRADIANKANSADVHARPSAPSTDPLPTPCPARDTTRPRV